MINNDVLYNFNNTSDLEIEYNNKLNQWLDLNEDYNERKYLKETIIYNERSFSHVSIFPLLDEVFNESNSHAILVNYQLTVRKFNEQLTFNISRKDTDTKIPLVTYLFNIYGFIGRFLKKIKSENPDITVANVRNILVTYTEEIFSDYTLVDDYINEFLKEEFYFTSYLKKHSSNNWTNDTEKYSFFDLKKFYNHLYDKHEVVKLLRNRLGTEKSFNNLKFEHKDDNDFRLRVIILKETGLIDYIKKTQKIEDSRIEDFISDLIGCTNRTVRSYYSINKLDSPTMKITSSYFDKLRLLKRDEMDGKKRKNLGLFLKNKN